VGVVVEAIATLSSQPPGSEWVLLAALTLLSGSFTVKLPGLSAKISISETFVFTSVLLFGPAGGTLIVVLDTLVISLRLKKGKRSAARVLFNVAAPAIALRLASEAFFGMSGAVPGHITRHDIGHLTIPIFALALLYFVVNTVLVACALSFERQESAISIWWTHFPQVSITYFVGSSVAMLVVAYTERIDGTVVGIILPLLVIWHLTFKRSMGRLEDASRHVAQMNELYLSTIETLAMAVDAKDQVTHGHIRRVQVYAVELARRLGVTERNQLKAIEAAALLHDMGKLAIPEHILNKPGKLTEAEFGKMKTHADIGADLLSSVRFPYPVVPIVRHHHENWNGTGYPNGLAGTDIPMGARILSVVDCFDALTSDRPYRPKLSNEAAFAILTERRGNMYDPLVVDTFIAAHPQIEAAARTAGEQARSLTSPSINDPSLAPIKTISHSTALNLSLRELRKQLDATTNLQEMLKAIYAQMGDLIPASICALYRYSSETDILTCIAVAGHSSKLLLDLEMQKGDRISGWALANERTIANSQASLDLGMLAGQVDPPLRSAMVTPVRRKTFVGALAVYDSRVEPYSNDHQYALERIADTLGEFLDTFDREMGRSQVTLARAVNE
jgi:putative nucleotidyltransferase with HDIG domain